MEHTRFPAVTEESIAVLIETFYRRIRQDAVLGPIFNAAIADGQWAAHLERMRCFWSSVMLASGKYSGNPVAVHRAVAGLERPLFANWLALFTATASDLFESAPAAEFALKAERIADSLRLAVFHRPGEPPEGLVRRPAA